MADLTFVDSHNMVAYLEKSEDNADFAEIVDFLNVSPIRYALTTIVMTKSSMWRDLHFDDEDGITCLTNTEIFKNLQLMGYEKLSDKLTFLKPFFSPQWKYLMHTILQCLSSKSTTWNEFGTSIASAVICLAKNQKFNFSKLIFDGMLRNLDPNSKKFLMYPRFLQLFLNNQIENLTAVFNDEYDTPSHTKKVFANMRRQGKDFSGTVTPLFATMLIQPQADVGEGSGQPTEPQHTPTTASPSHVEPIPTVASSSHPKKTQKHRRTKRKSIEISQSSGPISPFRDETSGSLRCQDTILRDRPAQTRFERLSKQSNNPPLSRVNTPGSYEERIELKELTDMCTKLSNRVLDLVNVKDAQALEIKKIESFAEKSLGDQEDASKQGRNEIDQDEGISCAASPTRPVDDSITDDITLAKTLMKTKSSASRSQKDKGVMFKEPSEPTTTSRPQSQIPAKDKRKGIMQEPKKPVKVKGKDQIKYDADVAQRLQAELDEEVRLEKEKEEKASKDANIAEWDDVQAMIDADYKLAVKLQAKEQREISIEERSRLFVKLMDKRKKHFAKLRVEVQRRKPPTKTQKRNIMSTYLKNMVGYKHTQLKNKSFQEIQMLFKKEIKRVNIFIDMDEELVKGRETREESGSKRAGDELKQESFKRQKIDDDDKEREDLKQCFEIVPEEEFVVHAIPLAVMPAPIVGFQIHGA
ncbi:hypothetical protein Tco_0966087 [Tanacetum coccineum]